MTRLEKLLKLIKDLMSARYYGKLIVNFNAGKIVGAKKEESIKFE